MTAPLVLPLGHSMGPFHQQRGAAPAYWVVRLGWDSPLLPDATTARVWALAHGPADGARPWTREALCAAAREAGVEDPAPVLDSLIDRGLVAEVTPGTAGAVEFAARHRVQSLLLGLGEVAGEPGLEGIGLLGMPPVARVPRSTYELWQWGHLWPTLGEAAAGLAEMAASSPGHAPEDADPGRVLERVLGELHTLLSAGAVYLDRSLAVADAER